MEQTNQNMNANIYMAQTAIRKHGKQPGDSITQRRYRKNKIKGK